MDRICLGQPDMAVNAGAFVKPAVTKTGIHAKGDVILCAVSDEVCQIEPKGRIAVVVSPKKASVNEYQSVSDDAIKLHPDAAPRIAGEEFERAAIPANASLRVAAAERLIAMRTKLAVALAGIVVHEGKLHGPIVRKVKLSPARIIEARFCKVKVSGLGKIALPVSEVEIFCRVVSIAEGKLPAEIEEQLLSGSNRRKSCRRVFPHGAIKHTGSSRPGRSAGQRCGRESQTGGE